MLELSVTNTSALSFPGPTLATARVSSVLAHNAFVTRRWSHAFRYSRLWFHIRTSFQTLNPCVLRFTEISTLALPRAAFTAASYLPFLAETAFWAFLFLAIAFIARFWAPELHDVIASRMAFAFVRDTVDAAHRFKNLSANTLGRIVTFIARFCALEVNDVVAFCMAYVVVGDTIDATDRVDNHRTCTFRRSIAFVARFCTLEVCNVIAPRLAYVVVCNAIDATDWINNCRTSALGSIITFVAGV